MAWAGAWPKVPLGTVTAPLPPSPSSSPGCWFAANGWADGVVVVPQELAGEALARALEKVRGENRVREELARGRSAREVFAEYGIL